MTNEEKFTDLRELEQRFTEFCESYHTCEECPISKMKDRHIGHCFVLWQCLTQTFDKGGVVKRILEKRRINDDTKAAD